MVAQTCKELQETNNKQQIEIDKLHSKVNNLAIQFSTMSTKDDLQSMKTEIDTSMLNLKTDIEKSLDKSIQSQLEIFFSTQDASGSNNGGFHSNFHSRGRDSNHFHRTPKLDFPRFDGDNPKSWIQKCEYYFQMHNIAELHLTKMEAIHMDGKTSKWYDNFCLTQAVIPWPYFCQSVCARFENPAHDNIVGIFNKLAQITTVDAYFEEFEYYKALLLGVHQDFPESYFIASFIGGLKEELRSSVLMFDPKTLLHAFSLARMQERTLVQARKAQGLCFNCDEAYKRGHVCKKQYLCVLIGEEAEEIYDTGVDTSNETDEEPPLESDMVISIHALTGTVSGETIIIPGFIKKKAISILTDTGSTHNFIDSALAVSLQCSIAQTGNLLVTVANGDKTVSSGVFFQLEWTMQGYKFSGDLRLLPLGGCDIVLGADWLRNLGDVHFNFSKLCITFKHKGKKITLTGVHQKSSLSMMSGSALKNFFQKHSHGIVGQFFSISGSPTPLPTPPPITTLLNEFSDVFTDTKTFPPERTLDHQIPLKENFEPVNLRPYTCPYIQKSIVEELVKEMLHSGIIQPSHNPFSSPILLVKKKDNTWRFFVDYRKLNNITIKDKFPIPIIEDLLNELHGSRFFTKIELKSGYHQIRVSPGDVHKTAFKTHHGHFEFKVMPFGLTNAPATFQALMNDIFHQHLRKFILVFFDDILVYIPSLETHLVHLQTTLELLRLHQLTANFSKCSFGQSSIDYLGHIITDTWVKDDPDKIFAMVGWPTPTNLKALRGFLGLTGYYRKFLKNYGLLSKPLIDLLKKDAFSWSPEATTTFLNLKRAMTTTPVLALPDFTKQFILETDACDLGIGAILMQEGRAIAFYNKPLGPRAAALSTYEKELLAIVQAVTKWKHYLQGQHFIIHIDHQSINYFLKQKISTTLQQKWLMKLLGFDYEVKYKKGSENKVADALSRRPHMPASCNSISLSQPVWAQEVIASYTADPKAQEVITQLSITPHTTTPFSYTNGRNKGEHTFPTGLLQPLPIPDHAWQHISMDFIEGLPMSERKSVILVVVYRLTKYIHFIGLHHPFTAAFVAREFISHVFNLHGLPSSIISDRDKIFTINFWQDLFQALGTQLRLSTAYHPQTDGQTERRDAMLDLLKEALHKSQERMKFYVDMKRTDRVFSEGDKVYLKLQPYRQTSVALRRNLKLAAKYYGPFTVIQKIGQVAYRLQLPVEARIHNVFHVSQLKQHIGSNHIPSPSLPTLDTDGHFLVIPAAALVSRTIIRNGIYVPQLIIQWTNPLPSDATWEDVKHIAHHFPKFSP
ncbi:uncharacterized protein LOC113295752 [Papaver somniferum]|uniref:uncharacterized protein LOC113295752 n=1 Tax=Papaver somniferum TaxID=3469 RepID=UPI000E7040E5|nr:uncharacterized protein LOC113295752 [Papaver somniferum]